MKRLILKFRLSCINNKSSQQGEYVSIGSFMSLSNPFGALRFGHPEILKNGSGHLRCNHILRAHPVDYATNRARVAQG